jgi:hypothetical protein
MNGTNQIGERCLRGQNALLVVSALVAHPGHGQLNLFVNYPLKVVCASEVQS